MMAQAGAMNNQGSRACGRGSVTAQSRLSEAETEVQARARVYRATAGQRNWQLSPAGSNPGKSRDGDGRS